MSTRNPESNDTTNHIIVGESQWNEIDDNHKSWRNKSKSIILGMNHSALPTRNNLILAVLGMQMFLTYSSNNKTFRFQDMTHWSHAIPWYLCTHKTHALPTQENLGDGSQAIWHICKLQASGRAQVTRKFPSNLRCNITSNVETSETSNNSCLSCFYWSELWAVDLQETNMNWTMEKEMLIGNHMSWIVLNCMRTWAWPPTTNNSYTVQLRLI